MSCVTSRSSACALVPLRRGLYGFSTTSSTWRRATLRGLRAFHDRHDAAHGGPDGPVVLRRRDTEEAEIRSLARRALPGGRMGWRSLTRRSSTTLEAEVGFLRPTGAGAVRRVDDPLPAALARRRTRSLRRPAGAYEKLSMAPFHGRRTFPSMTLFGTSTRTSGSTSAASRTTSRTAGSTTSRTPARYYATARTRSRIPAAGRTIARTSGADGVRRPGGRHADAGGAAAGLSTHTGSRVCPRRETTDDGTMRDRGGSPSRLRRRSSCRR